MKKTIPQETRYTKEGIMQVIRTLKNTEWWELPTKWADKDGGGGEYIQYEHFHVKVNPQKVGDLGSYELKTHRSQSNSLVSLGSLEPKDGKKKSLLLPLLLQYGYPYKDGKVSEYKCRDRRSGKVCKHVKYNYSNGLCYPKYEKALGIDICGKDVTDSPQNKWGFYLETNRTDKRIFMHFDSNRTSKKEKYRKWLNALQTRNGKLKIWIKNIH